jgi:hypothetical protein
MDDRNRSSVALQGDGRKAAIAGARAQVRQAAARRLARRRAAWAGFALASVSAALVLDAVVRPAALADWRGAACLGALAVCLVATPHLLRAPTPVKAALVIASAFATLVVLVEVPLRLELALGSGAPGYQSVDLWARVALLALVAYLLCKVVLLGTLLHPEEAPAHGGWQDELLPNQERALGDLLEALDAARTRPRGTNIRLVGDWGNGKSRVLGALASLLEDSADGTSGIRVAIGGVTVPVHHVAVELDIWKHETEADMHRSVVKRVLGHPRYVGRVGWLGYPVSLLLAPLMHGARVSLPFTQQATVDLDVVMPKLAWQHALENQVARIGRRCTTVLIVDEIDRAAPPAVQSFVALTARSLDLPKLRVVVAHVGNVMSFKAFNPLTLQPPDLRSTASAFLYDAAGDDVAACLRGAPAPEGATEGKGADGSSGKGKDRAQRPRPASSPVDDALAQWFVGLSKGEQIRIQRSLEERFSGSQPVPLTSFRHDDFARLVTTSSEVRPHLARLLPADADLEVLRVAITNALATADGAAARADTSPMPSLRSFVHHLNLHCNAVSGVVPASYGAISACAAAAWRIALLPHEAPDTEPL